MLTPTVGKTVVNSESRRPVSRANLCLQRVTPEQPLDCIAQTGTELHLTGDQSPRDGSKRTRLEKPFVTELYGLTHTRTAAFCHQRTSSLGECLCPA